MTKVEANTVLRPILSAIAPATMAPIAMPTKPMLTIKPFSGGVNCQSVAKRVMMNAIKPVSMASNIHPKPTTTNKR